MIGMKWRFKNIFYDVLRWRHDMNNYIENIGKPEAAPVPEERAMVMTVLAIVVLFFVTAVFFGTAILIMT